MKKKIFRGESKKRQPRKGRDLSPLRAPKVAESRHSPLRDTSQFRYEHAQEDAVRPLPVILSKEEEKRKEEEELRRKEEEKRRVEEEIRRKEEEERKRLEEEERRKREEEEEEELAKQEKMVIARHARSTDHGLRRSLDSSER